MAYNLRNRNFLKLLDFSPKEMKFLLDLSMDLKKAKYAGTEQPRLNGKNIALIFEKASTRTRCAFEVAAYDQGAHVTFEDFLLFDFGKANINPGGLAFLDKMTALIEKIWRYFLQPIYTIKMQEKKKLHGSVNPKKLKCLD